MLADGIFYLEDNISLRDLAFVGVRDADDRRFFDERMLIEDFFDFSGVDVEAANIDHVFFSAHNVDITVFVDFGHISG